MDPELGVKINFDNTENAFSHKSDKELKQLRWLFARILHPGNIL